MLTGGFKGVLLVILAIVCLIISKKMEKKLRRFRKSLGLAQIPLIIGLLVMAVAIPVATRLVEQNQDVRNRAASDWICQESQCKANCEAPCTTLRVFDSNTDVGRCSNVSNTKSIKIHCSNTSPPKPIATVGPQPSPAPHPATPIPTQGTVTPITKPTATVTTKPTATATTKPAATSVPQPTAKPTSAPSGGTTCASKGLKTCQEAYSTDQGCSGGQVKECVKYGCNSTGQGGSGCPFDKNENGTSSCGSCFTPSGGGSGSSGGSGYHSCPSSDGNPNKQACCDSSGNYVDWWLCGGAGDGGGGQTLTSFNGVVIDEAGARWVPGNDDCSAKKGSVSISSSKGNVKWLGQGTPDARFDVTGVPLSEVTVVLNPPGGCGYTCDKWRITDVGDNLKSWKVVAEGSGCTVKLTPYKKEYRSGITFFMKKVTPTPMVPPRFNVTIEGPTEVVRGETATFIARSQSTDVKLTNIKLYWGDKGVVDSLSGSINPWALFKECSGSNVTSCQGNFPTDRFDGEYYIVVNASTGSNVHCSGNPTCRSYPCSGFYDCGTGDNMVLSLSVAPTSTPALAPTAMATPKPTAGVTGVPTGTPTLCEKALNVRLEGWKTEYVANRGRRVSGTWNADVNRDGYVDIVDRSIILECLIKNGIM